MSGLAIAELGVSCSGAEEHGNQPGSVTESTAGTKAPPSAGTGAQTTGRNTGGTGAAGATGNTGPRAGTTGPSTTGTSGTGVSMPMSTTGGGNAPPVVTNTAGAAGGAGMMAALPMGQAGQAGQAGTTNPVMDMAAVWVSTTGADQNPGTREMPLGSLAAAIAKATAGMTIWIEPGTYALQDTVVLKTLGTQDKPVKLFAVEGAARPVFDFKAQPRGQSSARGFEISGDYWHLRGFDVVNAGDNCIHIAGGNNTVELVTTHDCSDTGIQISANSSEASDKTRAANNLILNCDSHSNYDAQNQGENADGFAAKLYIGPGNVFRGCRAWNNADDGWDLFASDDVVTIEDCWAIANGKIGPSQNNTNGDGNGFKLGGAATAGDQNMGGAPHEVKNCYSFGNVACGFVRNNNTQAPRLSMCGGKGDGKGLLCSLSNSGEVPVSMSAAEAIAAKRNQDGSLPPVR